MVVFVMEIYRINIENICIILIFIYDINTTLLFIHNYLKKLFLIITFVLLIMWIYTKIVKLNNL